MHSDRQRAGGMPMSGTALHSATACVISPSCALSSARFHRHPLTSESSTHGPGSGSISRYGESRKTLGYRRLLAGPLPSRPTVERGGGRDEKRCGRSLIRTQRSWVYSLAYLGQHQPHLDMHPGAWRSPPLAPASPAVPRSWTGPCPDLLAKSQAPVSDDTVQSHTLRLSWAHHRPHRPRTSQ